MTQTAILSRPGVYLNQTDGSWEQDNANFLKVFTGEVLSAYNANCIRKDLHRERTIPHGKSATFAVTGTATAFYHKPGEPILGHNQITHGERIINIDDLLVAPVAIYDLDDAKQHYDVRAEYSKQLGIALAEARDRRCLQVVIKAARTAPLIPGQPGGSVLTNANFASDAMSLASGIFSCAQLFDEKNIPDSDRNILVRPAQYYALVEARETIHKDYGGQGSYADGNILRIAGITLRKSNHLPNTVVTKVTGENNDYTGDFTKSVAVCFQREAIGTVKLKDLVVQKSGNDLQLMYQSTFLVARYAMGHGILRPECSIELALA
jgi:hypothetical protein